jgi:hypothetical protein
MSLDTKWGYLIHFFQLLCELLQFKLVQLVRLRELVEGGVEGLCNLVESGLHVLVGPRKHDHEHTLVHFWDIHHVNSLHPSVPLQYPEHSSAEALLVFLLDDSNLAL